MPEFTPIPEIDRFIGTLGATIIYREAEIAYYRPYFDQIEVAPRGSRSTAHHYRVVLHEHAHWTGHPTRLARAFGSDEHCAAFAREEIVAITACLHLCAYFGLGAEAAATELDYAKGFYPLLADQPRTVLQAIADGRRAALYLHERQGQGTVVPEHVLFRSADALTMTCFTAPLPVPPPAPAKSPLATLIERFGTAPRARLA